MGLCGKEHIGSPRKRVHLQCPHRAGEPGAELPKLPVLCCFFSFLSLLSPFRMRHLCSSSVWGWCPRASLMEMGEKPFNPYKGDCSGLWCFRSFKEVTEVPLSWLPSPEMWQMALFLLWPITLVSLCNKILGQKWKGEVGQEEGAGLTRAQWVGMVFAT